MPMNISGGYAARGATDALEKALLDRLAKKELEDLRAEGGGEKKRRHWFDVRRLFGRKKPLESRDRGLFEPRAGGEVDMTGILPPGDEWSTGVDMGGILPPGDEWPMRKAPGGVRMRDVPYDESKPTIPTTYRPWGMQDF